MPAPVLQFKRGNAGVAGTVPALRPGEPAISLNNFDFFIGIDTSVANNKFFGSHRYWGREDGTNALKLKLVDKDGTNSVNLKAPDTLAGIVTYTLPGTQGAVKSVLTNDGSGNLTWGSGSENPVFTGIATFSGTTDNTLGNPDTGSVQIDGGLGVNKNVTVGAGLSVTGQSHFIGTATFYGGQINLGDSDTDDIVVAGEFKSNLIPSDDATYNLGSSVKRWNNASFAGIGTFATGAVIDGVRIGISGTSIIDTTSGKLTLNSASGIVEIAQHLDVNGDLDVTGNVYIGGTTVTLRGTDVYIENKDIILGYTTSVTPNDTTANHAGVAIASTEGSPLVSFEVSGINTLPDTYKQMMWFKSGTLGFSTDAFAFNYGVAIGTTTMANGLRLKVGSGITMTDTEISATTFRGSFTGTATTATRATLVDTTTAPNGTFYPGLFVNATGTASTAVYVDSGISYVSNTDTLALTGDIAVNGGDVTTSATTFNLVNGTATNVNFAGAATALNMGATTGIATINNATLTLPNATTVNVNGVNPTLASSSTGTLTLFNTNLTSVNAFGAAAALVMGATTGVGTIRNATVSFPNATTVAVNGANPTISGTSTGTLTLFNTNLTSVNAFGAATSLNFGATTGIATINNPTVVGTQATQNLYNTVATNVNFAGAAAALVMGAATGITTVRNKLTVAGNLEVDGNNIQASDGNNNITLTSNTLTTFAGDIRVNGNDIQASNGTTAITLSSADVTIAGDLQITGNDIKSSSGDIAITLMSNDVTIADDLTVNGNLYVQGSTTQVNTAAITVEDRTIELGRVDGLVPSSSTTWDLGVLFNYNASGAKKSAVVWEHSATRFQFASVLGSDTDGTDVNTPQLSVTTFAPIEIGSLWVTDCAGTSQVISCTGTERFLENITIDAGQF
jgi:hypothetical protein